MESKVTTSNELRLLSIYKQAMYHKNLSPVVRFQLAMDHLESLRQMKRKIRRVLPEEI
jgi:hypothetical protein